jgi:hypothetical protein
MPESCPPGKQCNPVVQLHDRVVLFCDRPFPKGLLTIALANVCDWRQYEDPSVWGLVQLLPVSGRANVTLVSFRPTRTSRARGKRDETVLRYPSSAARTMIHNPE